jgi:hemerythrin-like domain-containing protein
MSGGAAHQDQRTDRQPEVLRCLFEEHRHLAALVRVLEEKAGQARALDLGDYYLLHDIVGYLHDYPDQVHHPTENLLFEKLVRRVPAAQPRVERLLRDHEAVAAETLDLLHALDAAIENPDPADEPAIRQACKRFARHQSDHMRRENRDLFPLAIDALARSDWRSIERHFAAVEDPLFGRVVGKEHRLLFEYLANPMDKVSEQLAVVGLLSQERLVLAADVLGRGAASGWSRLGALGGELSGEARAELDALRNDPGLFAAAGLPLRYGRFLGKALIGCSTDLLAIYTQTTRETLGLYGLRRLFG